MGIRDIRPRLIFSMGSLLDKRSRDLLESVFQGEVFDAYGATELGCIAWECPRHTGYHINIDTVILQLEKDGRPCRPGETGRIIATGLRQTAMPFIRYDTGDTGILRSDGCACGRGLPLLESLEGRADDYIVAMDGSLHSPSLFVNRLKLVPGIAQFRLTQSSIQSVSALIVPDRRYSPSTPAKAEQTLREIVGNDVTVRVDIVGEIPPDPSGKIRSIMSSVHIGSSAVQAYP